MSKKFSIWTVIVSIIVTVVITFNTTYTVLNVKHNKETAELLSHDSIIGSLLAISELINNNYAGDVDNEDLIASIVRGYLEGIGDRYSMYLTPSEYEAYKGQYIGNSVGIGIDFTYNVSALALEVTEVIADSPAEKAGIRAGDLIVAIDGVQAVYVGYYDLIDMITGESGTEVVLTVIRNNYEIDISCVRAPVEAPTVRYRAYSFDESVGVISISAFYTNTPKELKSAIEALQTIGCTKFVFDIRNNGGGELGSIIEALDYILPEGKITDIFYKSANKTLTYNSDAEFLDAPVAVLINGETASAAELFAAALNDYAKEGKYDATLVGTTTYGKGVFQQIFDFSDGSALIFTCGRFDPPSGINFDGVGVIPDVIEDLSDEAKAVGFYMLTDDIDNQLALAVAKLASK